MRAAHPFLPLVAGLALAAGCRSVPVPSSPDAESIIDGTAGVPVDSVDAPFEIVLERARWATRERTEGAPDFWGDLAHLDVARAERGAATFEERTFVAAMKRLMASDPDAAAVAFGALHRVASDSVVRLRSRIGLTMALTWNNEWEAIAAMGPNPDTLGQVDPRAIQSGVERWARAFAGIPRGAVSVPDEPITVPVRRSAFGTPVVTVSVNGRPHEFWLDTGASMTLLSTTVAREAGVRLASTDSLALGVVSGHVEARAIYVDSLALGSFVARGVTAAMVNPDVLRLDRTVVAGITHAIPIDGVIGADLIRHMDLVIDAAAGTLTIRRPRPDPRARRNLFWVGYPVVRLAARDGQPLLFGLDTGAEGTYVTTTLLRRLPRTAVAARRTALVGLGNERLQSNWVVRDLRVSDGAYAIALRNTPVAPERRWTFVTFDGVIGSDVALATRLHLDFTNGIFDVRPSEALPAVDGRP